MRPLRSLAVAPRVLHGALQAGRFELALAMLDLCPRAVADMPGYVG